MGLPNNEKGPSPARTVEGPETGRNWESSPLLSLGLQRKVARASSRKLGNVAVSECLELLPDALRKAMPISDVRRKLVGCATSLYFREEPSRIRLLSGNFCQNHLLCSPCAAARARRIIEKYGELLIAPGAGTYMLTLTWPSMPTPLAAMGRTSGSAAGAPSHAWAAEQFESELVLLRASLAIGLSAWRRLWARRKVKHQGPLRNVLGALLSAEITHSEKGWHPHFHIVCRVRPGTRIDARELREAWCGMTGGRQMRLDPLREKLDLLEAVKYAVKPMEIEGGKPSLMGVQWRYLAFQALRGRRLLFGYGDLQGIAEPDLGEESTGEDIQFVDWWAKWYKWCKSYSVHRAETVPSPFMVRGVAGR